VRARIANWDLIAAEQVTPTLLGDGDMAKFRALLVTKDGDRQSIAVTELTDAISWRQCHRGGRTTRAFPTLASVYPHLFV
jgi:hypothetical protein